LYHESKQLLKKFGFMSLDDNSQVATDINWKALYLEQHFANTKKYDFKTNAREGANNGLLSSLLSFSSSKVYPIPMFGEGLDSSAKKLLYNMMWSSVAPYKLSKLHAGVEGIGSGVGFNINGLELNLVALYKYEDRGIFDKVSKPSREDLIFHWIVYRCY
jgi:hypothetical protein